jgi:protoporphyrinogen IX oxidase
MMDVFVNLLFWLHFIGLGMGVGGGVALSLTGPRLKTAMGSQLDLVWTMEVAFSRVATIGIAILLVTGPLMVWLKFGGFAGFTWWFGLKMGFVGLAVVGAALHEWAGRRYRAGRGRYQLMEISGRLAGGSMIAAILCAVFAFN